jgi:hypothetical protein
MSDIKIKKAENFILILLVLISFCLFPAARLFFYGERFLLVNFPATFEWNRSRVMTGSDVTIDEKFEGFIGLGCVR